MSVLVSNHLEEELNIDTENGSLYFRLTSQLKDPHGYITISEEREPALYNFNLTIKYFIKGREPVVTTETLANKADFHKRADEISVNPDSTNWNKLDNFTDWYSPEFEAYVS